MAPVLSRSVASASVASVPHQTTSFSLRNNRNGAGLLRSSFLPQNGLRNSLGQPGLQWRLERRESRVVVKCEGGAAVAEKETPEAAGETHEYQAEVSRLLDLIVHSLYSYKEVFLRELYSLQPRKKAFCKFCNVLYDLC